MNYANAISVMGAASLDDIEKRLKKSSEDVQEMEERLERGREKHEAWEKSQREKETKQESVRRRVEVLSSQISTPVQAQGVIVAGSKALTKAAKALSQFSTLDLGLMRAQMSKIESIANYGQRIQKEPMPLDIQKKRAALFAVQATDVLRETRDKAKQSAISNSMRGIISEFAESLKEVLQVVVDTAPKVVPEGTGKVLYAIAALVGLGLIVAIAK